MKLVEWLDQLKPDGQPRHPGKVKCSFALNSLKKTYFNKHSMDAEIRALVKEGKLDYWEEMMGHNKTHKVAFIKLRPPPLPWDEREKVVIAGVEVEKKYVESK